MYGDGRGERGEEYSPLHAEVAVSGSQSGPGRTGSAESSQHDPHLSRGILPRAFLISLGLWPLPGGFWLTLFIPWALLAAFGGGR